MVELMEEEEDEDSNWLDSPPNEENNRKISIWMRNTGNLKRLRKLVTKETQKVMESNNITYGNLFGRVDKRLERDRDLGFLRNDGLIGNVMKRIGATREWFGKVKGEIV